MLSVFTKFLDNHTRQIFDVDKGKLKHVPNVVIWLVYIMSMSVLIQGLADVIVKILGYTPFVPALPWRIDFLSLTCISVVMGSQAIRGMRRRELDVTRNSMLIGMLVECALVISDVVFIYSYGSVLPIALPIRLPFIVLTTINICILLYVSSYLSLFKNNKGGWQLL